MKLDNFRTLVVSNDLKEFPQSTFSLQTLQSYDIRRGTHIPEFTI